MLWVLRYIHAHLALLQAPADLPRGATVPGVPHALPPPPPRGSEAAVGRCAQPRAIIGGELGCADNLLAPHISLVIISLS